MFQAIVAGATPIAFMPKPKVVRIRRQDSPIKFRYPRRQRRMDRFEEVILEDTEKFRRDFIKCLETDKEDDNSKKKKKATSKWNVFGRFRNWFV